MFSVKSMFFKIGLGIAAFVIFLAVGALFIVFSFIKNSQPYKMSTEFIKQNPVVIESLGAVKRFGYFPTARMGVNQEGRAKTSLKIKVVGEQHSASVHTHFLENEKGEWVLDNAWLLESSSDPRSLLNLSVTKVDFHHESASGPLVLDHRYHLGESLYWTVGVVNFMKKDGQAHLIEGLTILDAQGNVVASNPQLASYQDAVSTDTLFFENHASLPSTGTYLLKTLITDVWTGKQVEREDRIEIISSDKLEIYGLSYRDAAPDGPVKKEPVYTLGSPVFLNFNLAGVTLSNGSINCVEDLYVLDESGKTVLSQPGILTINEGWTTTDSLLLQNRLDVTQGGKYKVKIVVHDQNAGVTAETESSFSIQ